MGRHIQHEIKIYELPGRAKPFKVQWRERDPITGKRKPVAKFFETQRQAESFKANVDAVVESAGTADEPISRGGQHRDDDELTVGMFSKVWMDNHIVGRKKASTVRSYQERIDLDIVPAVGAIVLSDETFGYAQVVRVVSKSAKRGVAWGTQCVTIRVLSAMLSEAVKYGHLSTNPARNVSKGLKPSDAIDPEPNPLTFAQMEAFLAWVKSGVVPGKSELDGPRLRGGQLRSAGYPELYEYFLWLFRTGSRVGEAAALEWKVLQLTARTARLSKNYSPSEKARLGKDTHAAGDTTLKTKRPHDVELSPELVTALLALRKRRDVEELKRGRKSPYVFLTIRGNRMKQDSTLVDRIFERGMVAIGAAHEEHTLHDIRDTFATCHLLRDPKRLAWVSWMLGHKNISTTLTRYTKYLPDSNASSGFAADLDTSAAKLQQTAAGNK